MVGYTPPNRYQPRAGWQGRLTQWLPPPPAASWQSDMIMYYLWRTNDHKTLMSAWTKLRMRPANARTALDPASGLDRGLIPPDIFSRVLARSRATSINPNDDVADVIVEDPPGATSAKLDAMARRAMPARKKSPKQKAPKLKSAKSAKRKSPKRKAATPRSGQRGRTK